MKKVISFIIAIVIIIIAIFFINKLLYSNKPKFEITTTTKIINKYEGYSLISEDDYFQEYKLDDINEFSIELNNINIKYANNSLTINNDQIEDIIINQIIAKYEDNLVIPFKYLDNVYDGIYVYNMRDKSSYIINKLDKLYLSIDNIQFSKNTIDVIYKNVYEKEILINGKLEDICSVKYDNQIIKENVSLIYDINENSFLNYEEYAKLTFESYKNMYKYCSWYIIYQLFFIK